MSTIGTWFKALFSVLASPYLQYFWFVVLGYLGCWLFAMFLARLSKTATPVFLARQSLAIAFMVHALAMLVVIGLWWREYFPFRGFYLYLTPYIALTSMDFVVVVKLMVGLGAYRQYGR